MNVVARSNALMLQLLQDLDSIFVCEGDGGARGHVLRLRPSEETLNVVIVAAKAEGRGKVGAIKQAADSKGVVRGQDKAGKDRPGTAGLAGEETVLARRALLESWLEVGRRVG